MASVTTQRRELRAPTVRHPVISAVVHAGTTALMAIQHRMFLQIDDPAYQVMAYAVPTAWAVYYAWFAWSRRCLIRECGGDLLRDAMSHARTVSKSR